MGEETPWPPLHVEGRMWFAWLTEYPDEGSLVVEAADAEEAILRGMEDFGEEDSEYITVAPCSREEFDLWVASDEVP